MTTIATDSLSQDQQQALDKIVAWYQESDNQVLTMGGYAGSGKTTTMGAVANTLRAVTKSDIKIAFACYTGKAAMVLRQKLVRAGALRGAYCGTIHGLIYKPLTNDKGQIEGWDRSEDLDCNLLIIDEASMVDEQTLADLKSYGVKILAIGDHGQLPPVQGSFNLMANPEIRLEKIHRQAEGNPIIRAATLVREGGKLPICDWGSVVKVPGRGILEKIPDLYDTMVICGTNRNRVALNGWIRQHLGFTNAAPQLRERVICLRNNKKKGIFNGMPGRLDTIYQITEHQYSVTIKLEGVEQPYVGSISRHQFGAVATLKGTEIPGLHYSAYGDLWDWGYAITCHKSQGSESRQVVVFEDCDWMKDEDMKRRWNYTAYTRASEKLIVIGK